MEKSEFKLVTSSMRDALRKPLPDEAIKPHPTKTYLSSIKAIYVTERLNEVFGIGSWKLRTDILPNIEITKGMVVVKASLTIEEYNIYLESFGGNDNGGDANKNFDLGDAFKGATTDAITKICSYLEIGIDVFKGKVKAPAKSTPKPIETPKPIKKDAPTSAPTRGGMVPNDAFELPVGLLEDLAKANTFEDLIDVNKKYKAQLGDESVKTIFAQKMSEQFSKLPAEEQAKKK